MREILHFAHGNGFPSPCYNQLLQHLQLRFDCCYIDRVGHSPAFPVTENWHHLVDEVIVSIQSQSTKPVIAVGHSLGGVLTLLAAIHEPSLFKAIILLDSPLIGRMKSRFVRLSKMFGVIDRVTPAFKTRERKQHWESREQVLSYLKSKPLFKTFSESCLNDYIDFGLEKNEGNYSLRFDRQIEYQIYCTIPHILREYEGRLRVPTGLIYGSRSAVVSLLDIRYMKKYYGITCIKTNGSHMFPMENPKAAAREIINLLERLGAFPHP